ncbi:MAG: hypothetical protein AABY40_04665 [Nanoarchaeota archaeon]
MAADAENLRWYERSFELIILGAAGGFVVAMAQELSTNGKVPLLLSVIAFSYIFFAFWIEYMIRKRN